MNGLVQRILGQIRTTIIQEINNFRAQQQQQLRIQEQQQQQVIAQIVAEMGPQITEQVLNSCNHFISYFMQPFVSYLGPHCCDRCRRCLPQPSSHC